MTLLGETCRRWQDNIKIDHELERRSVNYNKGERKEMLRGFWCGNLKKLHYLEKLVVDGRIILKLIMN